MADGYQRTTVIAAELPRITESPTESLLVTDDVRSVSDDVGEHSYAESFDTTNQSQDLDMTSSDRQRSESGLGSQGDQDSRHGDTGQKTVVFADDHSVATDMKPGMPGDERPKSILKSRGSSSGQLGQRVVVCVFLTCPWVRLC